MKKRKLLCFLCLFLVGAALSWGSGPAGAAVVVPVGAAGFNPFVNYNIPNFAYSPNIRKFVNGLPGLGAAGCVLGTLWERGPVMKTILANTSPWPSRTRQPIPVRTTT